MRTRTVTISPLPQRPSAANDRPAPPPDRMPTPETPLVVSFVGLTLSEQRAALAGFPGGRRFVLATSRA